MQMGGGGGRDRRAPAGWVLCLIRQLHLPQEEFAERNMATRRGMGAGNPAQRPPNTARATCQRIPPEMFSVCPVMYFESDDARNTAAGEISPGWAIRPSGVCVTELGPLLLDLPYAREVCTQHIPPQPVVHKFAHARRFDQARGFQLLHVVRHSRRTQLGASPQLLARQQVPGLANLPQQIIRARVGQRFGYEMKAVFCKSQTSHSRMLERFRISLDSHRLETAHRSAIEWRT